MQSVHSEKYKAFLRLLIKARMASGLTQQQLAHKLGKHQSYVSKYESGERRLDVIEFIELTNIFSIDPCNLIRKIN